MKQTILFLCFFWSFLISAQSKEVLAKAAFLKAQELYGNAEYAEAIVKLIQTKEYLNGTNPRVDYLLTMCAIETGDVKVARTAIKSYFDNAAESDQNYMAMLNVIPKLEDQEKAFKIQNEKSAAALAQQKKDQQDWDDAQVENSLTAFEDYLNKYPNGEFVNLAKERIGTIKKYDGQVITRRGDMKPKLASGEYTYIIGSPEYLLDNGTIELTFERINRIRGRIFPAKILVNGEQVISLSNGKTESIIVPAGKLTIGLGSDLEKFTRMLIYPSRRKEKFFIDLSVFSPKDYVLILQHEATYKFEEEVEETDEPIISKDH